MKIYKYIPYDKELVSRARELRKSQTEVEEKFWEIVKRDRLAGFKFTRQKPIGNFIVDFYCAEFRLAIELDGKLHEFQKERDKERDNLLKQKFGVRVVRYNNEDILKSSEKFIDNLLAYLKQFPPDKGARGLGVRF